ncbi:peptide ABC transporter permease [Lichenihabitans psoromatis]|uniref:peptide ABC transporter permease n=1 Tax=Lichenihabitans psoromatis TaxID=2528642 RepID=UPI0010382F0D|nr:peptide ABC transporter permease [Lichenihabitans psoromatis]
MPNSTQKFNEDPAEDAAVLLLRIGLAVLAMAVPISMVLSRRALFILVPIGAGLLLVAGLLLSDRSLLRRLRTTLLSTAGLSGLGLLAWSALSLVWSPVGIDAAERLAKIGGTLLLVIVTAAFLPERTRTSNLNLFPLGIVAAVAFTLATALGAPGAFSFQTDDSTLERAVVSLVVLVWPSLGALAIRDRWMAAGLIVVAVAVAAMAAWTSVALAALALGSLTFAIATIDPGRIGRLLGVVVAVLFLFAPAVPFGIGLLFKGLLALFGDRLPDLTTATETMRIWATIVVSEPVRLITGHGLDMATLAPLSGFLPPQTPKSLLFEIWYNFGVIGAVLAAVLSLSAFRIIGHLSPTVAPFVLAEFVAVLTIAFCGLDTTQLWWVTLLGVVALAFATVVRGQYRTSRPMARLEPSIAPPPRGQATL